MTAVTSFERYMERISRGDRLTSGEIQELAATPDILSLGMLADALRRRWHETRVTFLRVMAVPFDAVETTLPAAAREVRLTGSPGSLDAGVASVETVKAISGDRTVAGFSWVDIARWSGGSSLRQVLTRLRRAGLDALAEVPLDNINDPVGVVQQLRDTGFDRLRLTIDKAPAETRSTLLRLASELQDSHGGIQSLNPLPLALTAFRPTTGYEDVRMVALARLAAAGIPSIQVDWQRYGPKLAQVALTFGADDLDGVSASDDAPAGRRRAPLAEIERNVEAAGFTPVERDGRFNPL